MEIIKRLSPNELIVFVDTPGNQVVSHLVASLSVQGNINIIDGGNTIKPYEITRLIRRKTHRLKEALNQIHISRVFTAYQMIELLRAQQGIQGDAVIILDMLTTFWDDSLTTPEAHRLLLNCLTYLEAIKTNSPVLVTLKTSANQQPERGGFVGLICESANQVIGLEETLKPNHQLNLFEGFTWDAH